MIYHKYFPVVFYKTLLAYKIISFESHQPVPLRNQIIYFKLLTWLQFTKYKLKVIPMGINGSKNQYSFNDHYYVVEDSFPTDSFYRLQSKITDELFVGREIQCLDKQDAHEMECIINQKLTNPSPFVTKLLSGQSNQEKSYCETHKKYYLLYREVTKTLGHQIQQRRARKQPFSAEQVSAVIVRISKGLKHLYEIGHHHGNVSANAITWPAYQHESIQLIDQWALRNQNRLINKQQNKESYQPDIRNFQQSDDLYNLGLVAKTMMDISPNMPSQNPQIAQSLKHKIFILLSQNQLDRLHIYSSFTSWDRELENRIITNKVQTTAHQKISSQLMGQSQSHPIHHQQQQQQQPVLVNYNKNHNINIEQKVSANNSFIGGQKLTNLGQISQINQISTQKYQTQTRIQQPSLATQNVHSQPTMPTTDFNKTKVNFGGKTIGTGLANLNNVNNTTTNTILNKYQAPPQISSTSTITNFAYNITNNNNHNKPAVSFGGSALGYNYNSNNNTNATAINFGKPTANTSRFQTSTTTGVDYYLKDEFNKIAGLSTHPTLQSVYTDNKKIDLPAINETFHHVSAPSVQTDQKSTNNFNIDSYTSARAAGVGLSSLGPSQIQQPNVLTSYTPINLNSGSSPTSNFSPTFGSAGLSSGQQSSLFSFQASSSNNNNTLGNKSAQENLFTSPDFFNKMNSKEKTNSAALPATNTTNIDASKLVTNLTTNLTTTTVNTNIVIGDYDYLNVAQQQIDQQPKPTSSIDDSLPNGASSHSYIAPLSPIPASHTYAEQHLPSVTTSSQFASSFNPATYVYTGNSSAASNAHPSLYMPNNTVIPELGNEQSEPEDQEREYVVEEYENGSRYEGEKVDNMRDGKGKFYYKEGSYYDGAWKNNNMHGFGKLYYPNHKLAYEGDWFIDQFHGHGKVYNDEPSPINGCFDYTNFDNIEEKWKFYEGTLVCDSKEGFGKLVLSNNEYYEGNFQGDRVSGEGKFVNMFGETVHGIWEDSKLIKVLDL